MKASTRIRHPHLLASANLSIAQPFPRTQPLTMEGDPRPKRVSGSINILIALCDCVKTALVARLPIAGLR
jgi:hypothetical protein